MTPEPRPRRAVLALAALALAACTATQLAYNNLDWVVGWQVGRYVSLEPPQKALFDEGFREFWAWHRATQLTLYAKDLRELAEACERPLSPDEVSRYLIRTSEHGIRALKEVMPDLAHLLAIMDDRQVKDMLGRMARQRREKAEETADLDAGEIAGQAEDNMVKNLKRWIGSLDKAQRARVAAWSHQRRYAGTIWEQYAEDWAALFAELLRHRREPGFEAKLAELFREPRVPRRQMMAELSDHNRRVWVALLSELSGSLSDGQRRRLQGKLRELASDFDALAAQSG